MTFPLITVYVRLGCFPLDVHVFTTDRKMMVLLISKISKYYEYLA